MLNIFYCHFGLFFLTILYAFYSLKNKKALNLPIRAFLQYCF